MDHPRECERPRCRGPRQSNTTNDDTVTRSPRARATDRRMRWLMSQPTTREDYEDAARAGYLDKRDIPQLGRAS
jgi:hypothetical protein